MSLPYVRAEVGANAFAEIERILRNFGCANFDAMNDWTQGSAILQS